MGALDFGGGIVKWAEFMWAIWGFAWGAICGGGTLGSPLLNIAIDIATQRHNTIFDSNHNLRRFNSRLPFKLIHNILL